MLVSKLKGLALVKRWLTLSNGLWTHWIDEGKNEGGLDKKETLALAPIPSRFYVGFQERFALNSVLAQSG